MSNVTQKIQVLLTDDDMSRLNTILMLEALKNKDKPLPISTFVRNLIKEHISSYNIEQKSFVSDVIKKHMDDFKNEK
jgi:hypothetical protein